jgi:protein-S-isoprenylcysteine O-methyltransferase Ste14
MQMLELKIPPGIVVLIFAAGMWISGVAVPQLAVAFPAANVMAVLLLVAGFALGFAAVITFRKARTTLNPMKPEASSALVTSGVFSRSRNPIYLGMLLVLCGWAISLANLLAFIFLPLFVLYMNRFQIMPEERFISARFGSEYQTYIRRVRRWL